MSTLRKSVFIGLMLVVALVAAACGGGGDDGGGSPDEAAKGLMEALFAGNVDDAKNFVCDAQVDQVNAETFAMPEGMEVDVSGLSYETTSEDGDNATVVITGNIRITGEVEGQEVDQSVDVSTLSLGEVPVVQEDGSWKVCDPNLGT